MMAPPVPINRRNFFFLHCGQTLSGAAEIDW
jgi:hypothetical protein